jgi:hypothetical protein
MNKTNFEHAAYAVLMQLAVGLLTGNWFAGAMLGIGFFAGREHSQAEYRSIAKFYDGKRANMPVYAGFMPRAWSLDSILDLLFPIIAVLIVIAGVNWY